jgi:hypothetical protein
MVVPAVAQSETGRIEERRLGRRGNNDDEDAAALEVLGRVKKRWERMSLSEARRSGSSTRMDRTNEAASF